MSTTKSVKLDEFEETLERSFHKDKWTTIKNSKEREKAMNAAKLAKTERTNIRLSESDLLGIKQKAIEKGLGYQTLISSLVHQYVTGRLLEVDSSGLSEMVFATVNAIFEKNGSKHPRTTKTKRRAP
ncbi:hypothetical protein WDW37_03810 [Bdellovibrionota bacterium FG-1]